MNSSQSKRCRLTVEEHLWFYARLKGQQPDSVRAQSEQMVVDLGNPGLANSVVKMKIMYINKSLTILLQKESHTRDTSKARIYPVVCKEN